MWPFYGFEVISLSLNQIFPGRRHVWEIVAWRPMSNIKSCMRSVILFEFVSRLWVPDDIFMITQEAHGHWSQFLCNLYSPESPESGPEKTVHEVRSSVENRFWVRISGKNIGTSILILTIKIFLQLLGGAPFLFETIWNEKRYLNWI